MASRLGESGTPPSETASQELAIRRKNRDARRAELRRRAREFEVQGYRLLQAGNYDGAIERFQAALKSYGSRSALWFNITKAHIRLSNWKDAEEAATKALMYDPQRTEARYLRGIARKELRKYAGAIGDLESVLEDQPDYFDALEPLDDAKRRCSSRQTRATADDLWPSGEHEAIDDTEPESDTSDCLHVGDNVPCQHYNRRACGFGTQCYHSHAPDEKSWRDRRGKNVCIHFMMGCCQYSDKKCKYSHVMEYLPPFGWWSKPERKDYIRENFQAADRLEQESPKTLLRRILHSPLPTWFWRDEEDEIASYPVVALPDHLFAPVEYLRSPRIVPPVTPPRPANESFVLVLVLDDPDLFSKVHGHLISTLKSKTRVVIASNPATALSHIESPGCTAIFLGDVGIARRPNHAVLTKFVDYIKKGGTGVVGGTFSSFVDGDAARTFFKDAFDLPWERGAYFRTTFSRNPSNEIVRRNPSLETSYSMKALHLSGLKPGEAVYHDDDEDEAPVVSTIIGKGCLAYIGDVNGEDDSTTAALALLGLLDAPHPVPTVTSTSTESIRVDLQSFAKPKAASKPFIMVLSQGWEQEFEAQCAELFSQLKERVEVLHGLSIDRILDLLHSPGLGGIFVSSSDILEEENAPLVPALGAYVKSGGILVFGGLFSAHARFDKFTGFIRSLSGFDWSIAACTSSSLVPNGKHALLTKPGAPSLPQNFQTKTLFISGITPDMALYVAANGEQYHKPLKQTTKAPIIYAECGEGWLGIIGDVNWKKESAQIIFAMFGLKGR